MLKEPTWEGEFLLGEAPNGLSRDSVIIAANQTILAGTVLGKISIGTLSVFPTKTGSGNGAITAASVAPGSQVGTYAAVCIGAATNGGIFMLQDPGGVDLGTITVGTPFTLGGLTATIADGSTDWAVGDQVSYLVVPAANPNDSQFVRLNPTAVDGSQNAAGIAWRAVTTGASGAAGTDGTSTVSSTFAIMRSAVVKSERLDWGTMTAPQIAAASAQLAARQIIIR